MLNILKHFRKVYFFGYGADREPDMLRAVTGRKPHVIGTAELEDYELRVQTLDEITDNGAPSPRYLLGKSWGKGFKSYVIVPKRGAKVTGTLFRISLHDRHLVDTWEMVDLGWYDKIFVTVRLKKSGKLRKAETQVLGKSGYQQAREVADSQNHPSWLQPKAQFMRIAEGLRNTKYRPM